MPRGRPRKMKPDSPALSLEVRRESRSQERQHLREELQIGSRLRQVRSEHHLTQEQVAAELTLNRTAYTHYENGVNMPDILTLVRLAAIYEVPPGEFVQFLVKTE